MLTAYAPELAPVVAVPEGCSVDLTFGRKAISEGSTEILRVPVLPWEEGMTVRANLRIGFDPDIEVWADSAFWQRSPCGERLRVVTSVRETMVLTFEYD